MSDRVGDGLVLADEPWPRDEAAVQADVNIVLETLRAGHRLAEEAHRLYDTKKGLHIDFALDAVKRLRTDAIKGVTEGRSDA